MLVRLTLAVFVATAIGLSPSQAAAHGGPLVFSGEAGPYRAEAYRIFGVSGEQRVVTYTLHLTSAATGRPVEGATVVVAASREGEIVGPTAAWTYENEYEVQFEVGEGEETWTVEVAIDASLGRTTLTHTLAAPPSMAEAITPFAVPLLITALLWSLARIRSTRRKRGRRMS